MESINVRRQIELIDDLAQLIAERHQSELSIHSSREARDATNNTQFTMERDRRVAQFQRDRDALQVERNNELGRVALEYEAGIEESGREHDGHYRETVQQAERAVQEAQEEHDARCEALQHNRDEAVRETARRLHDFKEKVEQRRDELRELESVVERIVRRRRCARAARQLPVHKGSCQTTNPLEEYAAQVEAAKIALAGFRQHGAAKFLASGSLFVIFVFTWIAAILAAAGLGLLESMPWPAVVVGGVLALGITAIVYVAVRPAVVRQTLAQYAQFRENISKGDTAMDVAIKVAMAEADNRRSALKRQCKKDVQQAADDLSRRREEIAQRRETRLREAAEQLQAARKEAAESRQRRQGEVNQRCDDQGRQLQETFDLQSQRLQDRHQGELDASANSYQRGWDRLVEKWTGGLSAFQNAVGSMSDFCDRHFPDWGTADWRSWTPPDAELPAVRFGAYELRLDMFENGLPRAEDLHPARDAFSLPAVITFDDRPSLLFEAWAEGRAAANRAIQNVMLRLLTSLPPSKVRFTIMDPVGLGQNFSAFMHLADFDEKLVTHRIWTEAGHIHQRLSDLTEHMEDVIQTYLRNEFHSINEYNRHAGEVAEPFHVLVVANFPAGFSEEAAQRLLSIANSGARCGVFTLISTDSKIDLPRNFDLADLEANAVTLQWNGERFCWLDEELKDLPLQLDDPPEDDDLTEIIRAVGQRAQEASRVEVPFSTVTPDDHDLWTQDGRGGLDVALGRAGASKLQYLRLGKGTSQHVLISGKTGSGKSTMLHVLITNTALRYSPDEVEFYLIDFKKGVEFKPYAATRLPHARVVAIESEREFGMSVLERLDVELRRRGDLYREHGVQDIRSFRNAFPEQRMPRVLLIIDEFQEFFVQDDKLAQDAALLLDRLVRQGRAFGIHVLLGSQTLAGAYSLARSTLGQMAIRIALQCSEADSHLILSEDNTAARLLRRPGEAIYNDANGLFEGNHPFQVVWLAGQEHESYLQRIGEFAATRKTEVPPQIVFEGNVAADPGSNAPLRKALANTQPAAAAVSPKAWLGAAVSIKEPTAAAFFRQSGANLVLVGQQEEMAMGVLANCLVSLSAECVAPTAAGGPQPRFVVLDGTRPESPEVDFWKRFAEQLPLDVTVATPSAVSEPVQEVFREVTRRQDGDGEPDAPIFLLVYNLSRFRDLRKSEEDFGFSSFSDDKPPGVDRQFTTILREGPALGVHSLIWCDTYNNMSRCFDRQALRDLDQRVLFQMSATDSSNLMDSPLASRLGVHRAILYSEERGQFEKFRPYGLPSSEWIGWVCQQLARRSESHSAVETD